MTHAAALARTFARLAAEWRDDTDHLSSVPAMVAHPAYLRIIGMGRAAVPLILDEMRSRGGHWFVALAAITGENPIAPDDRGRVRAMTDAWLRWGAGRGYLSGSRDLDVNLPAQ